MKQTAESKSCSALEHPDHSKELHRISRIIGQLEGVRKMIQQGAYCPEILNQTRAVTSAVRSLEAKLLESHLEHCVREAMRTSDTEGEQKIAELLEVFRKAR